MAVRERKFFVGGNWKMNGSKASIDGIVEFLLKDSLSADSGISMACGHNISQGHSLMYHQRVSETLLLGLCL